MASKVKYDESSIQWLQGPAAIRANVPYYLGESGSHAVRQAPIEVIGNLIDESASGHGDTAIIKVDKDNTVTVWDFGRGIPHGKHPKHPDRDVLTLLFTELHTGGKKGNQEGYEAGTVGTHGLGLTVVNAVSTKCQVWSFAKSSTPHSQTFEKGKPVTGVVRDKNFPPLPYRKEKAKDIGTIVRFTLDLSVFDRGAKLDYTSLIDWVKELSWFSYCNVKRGTKIVERRHVEFIFIGPDGKAGKIKRKGLLHYFEHACTALKVDPVILDAPFSVHTPSVDMVLGWSGHEEEHVKAYSNGVLNTLGGTHHKAFMKMVDQVFRKYAKKASKYKIADLLVGAIGCINVRIKAPRFNGQSKALLVSPEAETVIFEEVMPILEKWARINAAQVKELIERAEQMNALTSQLKDDKKLIAALKTKKSGKTLLPPKMLVSHTKNASERELFIVEGDSAKGGCKEASDRYYQEVLPLRGKLPNLMRTEKKKKGQKVAEVNQTIVDILKATGITPADGTTKMRVGKIMLLMDADSDGGHIASLVLSLFLKYAPELFEEGKIFFVDTPLYAHQNKSGVKTYARDYNALVAKLGDKIDAAGSTLTRAKGLGELNSDILQDVVFSPKTRKLIRITDEVVTGRVKHIMGDDREFRKQMLGVE